MTTEEDDRRILGVAWDANPQDVRKAYLRGALHNHPDKTGTDPKVFIELQQAYHRLLERQETPHDHEAGCNARLLLQLLCCLVFRMMNFWTALQRYKNSVSQNQDWDQNEWNQNHIRQELAVKPLSIVVDIVVTLEDIYYARVKKLVLRVKSNQNGGCLLLKRVLIPLLQNKTCYMFDGMGDEAESGGVLGDVVVNVVIAPHSSGAHIDENVNRNDLHVTIKTTIHDFVFGKEIVIPDIPGGEVRLWYGAGEITPLTHVCITGRGLPHLQSRHTGEHRMRGDLYVFFQLKLPKRPTVSPAELEHMSGRALLSALSCMDCRGTSSSGSSRSSRSSGSRNNCDGDIDSDVDSAGVSNSWTDISRWS